MINKKKHNIFICNSIFHLILTLGIILNFNIKNKSYILILNDNNFLNDEFYNKLLKNGFIVKIIKTNSFIKRYLNPLLIRLPNIEEKESIDTYFFINYSFSNQILNLKIKKKYKNVVFNIIEEGIGSYIKRNKSGFFIRFINFILNFFNLKITKNWGDLKYIDKKYLRFPEFINDKKGLIKYNILSLINNNFNNIKDIILGDKKISFGKNDIIFISNSFVFTNLNEYIKKIEEIKNDFGHKNFYIKPHPRENIEIFKNIKNIKIIDKSIPVELIGNNTNIITFYSSSILNLNSNIIIIKNQSKDFKKLLELIKYYNIKNIKIIN